MRRMQTSKGLVEFGLVLTPEGFEIKDPIWKAGGEPLTEEEVEELLWEECEEIAREERQHKRDLEMEYWKERN